MNKKTLPEQIRDTIARGTLTFQEDGRSVSFCLRLKGCTVSGPLNVRQDWLGKGSRPGVMLIILHVGFASGDRISGRFLQEKPELVEDAYPILQQRLSPEKILEHDDEHGWLVTSFKSKALDVAEIDDLA